MVMRMMMIDNEDFDQGCNLLYNHDKLISAGDQPCMIEFFKARLKKLWNT